MNWRKLFQRTLAAILVAMFTIFSAAVAHAEIKTYEGVGEYWVADKTVKFAKNQAKLQAQRDALEQVSFFIKSGSHMGNGILKDDEIITITAGILHVINTEYDLVNDNGDILVKAYVTAEIDTVELEKLLEEAVKSKQNH